MILLWKKNEKIPKITVRSGMLAVFIAGRMLCGCDDAEDAQRESGGARRQRRETRHGRRQRRRRCEMEPQRQHGGVLDGRDAVVQRHRYGRKPSAQSDDIQPRSSVHSARFRRRCAFQRRHR